MNSDFLMHEMQYWKGGGYMAGADEAGRGPLAGPVVAAAVIFPKECIIEGINDSKKLTEKKREQRQKNPEQHPSKPLLFSEPCPEAKRARPDDPRQQHDEIIAQAIGRARGENSVK